MAAVGEVRNQPTLQNRNSLEVITLSSDEEEIEETVEDVNRLFDRFILACRPHLQNEALLNARNKFKEAPRDFVRSKEIASMLKRYTEQVNKDNAVVYMESVGTTLADGKEAKQRCVPNQNNIEESRRDCVNGISDVSNARDFEEVESEDREKIQTISNVVTANSSKNEGSVAEVSDDEVDFVCEKVRKSTEDIIPSISTAPPQYSQSQKSDEIKLPRSGKLSTKDFSVKQQKKLVANLKTRLKEISQEIKILSKSELTLDEMKMADSNYIKESQLKKKFDKTWNKLCKILGRPPNTGRVVEKRVHASKTGYSIIDKAIMVFLDEKRGKFPDYFDIRDLILEANKIHDLRMSPKVLKDLIEDVFTDIGNKLQKLREKDLIFNFGSHVLDDFKTEEDPALTSEELSKKLERNSKISKKNMKHIFAEFTHLERHYNSMKNGGPSTSMDMVAKESKENGNTNSDETTDDDQELSKSVNVGFLSEESLDSSQPCSSKTILRNGSPTNYERHSISDDESTESARSCKSRTLSQRSPKTANIETKCPSECVASRTITCTSSVLDKDSDVALSCSSGALVNNRDQATITSLKMENGADNATPITIDNCQIVIVSQDEEAVSSNHASDAPVSLACTVPMQTNEHKLPDNSTSVVNDDCENDDCQIIIDSPGKKAGLSNTSQTCDTSSDKKKPNIDNPMTSQTDDCQIIIDSPDEEACSSTTNQVHSTSNSQACGFPTMTNEQKPNIATANTVSTNTVENSKFSENNHCHIIIDSTDEIAPKEVNRTNGKKRKASSELTMEELKCKTSLIEKVALALRNKRLKTPCVNPTEELVPLLALNKLSGRQPLKDKEIVNGMNSPPLVNGKVLAQIPSQHRQAFREKTLNALKNKQQDMPVNVVDYHGGTSSISVTASESPRQETANIKYSTNTIRTNCETHECEVIVIDD